MSKIEEVKKMLEDYQSGIYGDHSALTSACRGLIHEIEVRDEALRTMSGDSCLYPMTAIELAEKKLAEKVPLPGALDTENDEEDNL